MPIVLRRKTKVNIYNIVQLITLEADFKLRSDMYNLNGKS